jgi:hypothetical protein
MYEAKFDAGQEHDVELQYVQRSAELSDDAPNDLTAKFYCMLNPAKTFEEFGTLDIAIQIHKPNTQLTADGFAFKLQDGVYRASFNTLPTQDLYFTARHDSRTEVQKKDPVSGFIGSAIAVLYIIVGIAVFSTIVIEIAAIKSVLSRRSYKKDH